MKHPMDPSPRTLSEIAQEIAAWEAECLEERNKKFKALLVRQASEILEFADHNGFLNQDDIQDFQKRLEKYRTEHGAMLKYASQTPAEELGLMLFQFLEDYQPFMSME